MIAANAELAADSRLNFVGNVEGVGIASGTADVVVTDGFTGNVALKLMEGVSGAVVDAIRSAATSDARAAAGALLLRPALGGLRDQLDPEVHGGAHLIGLRKVAIIPHGRFGAQGYSRAISLAAAAVESDAVGRTHSALQEAGVLRGS